MRDERNDRKLVITGAHGFIGRHAARLFAGQGYRVIGMGHGSWRPEEWTLWGIESWHACDVEPASLREYAADAFAIVHCAGSGSVPFSFADPWMDFHRTVLTTATVLEHIRTVSPSTRVVFPSSAGVYGSAIEFPIPETAAIAPISPYGIHKRMAEELIVSYAQSFGVSAAIVRFFSIFGVGLRKQFLWDACGKLVRGETAFMGTGDEIRDWLHVDDAASLLNAALEHAGPNCPIVNGGTGEGASVREILQYLAAAFGLRGCVPKFNGMVREGDPRCYVADVQKAHAWGWRPQVHWKERLIDYCDWWRGETGLRPAASSMSPEMVEGTNNLLAFTADADNIQL